MHVGLTPTPMDAHMVMYPMLTVMDVHLDVLLTLTPTPRRAERILMQTQAVHLLGKRAMETLEVSLAVTHHMLTPMAVRSPATPMQTLSVLPVVMPHTLTLEPRQEPATPTPTLLLLSVMVPTLLMPTLSAQRVGVIPTLTLVAQPSTTIHTLTPMVSPLANALMQTRWVPPAESHHMPLLVD